MLRAVGRFEPTGPLDVPGLAHSVAELSWGVMRGANGPSDGTAGAGSNVPSALGVLRHAAIYAGVPAEIDEAFAVLETHVMRHDVLYPVSVAVVPILLHTLRKPSSVNGRIANVIGRYATVMSSLEAPLAKRLEQILVDHSYELVRWLGTHDRALGAIMLNVPALRPVILAAVEGAERVSPEILLALLELGEAPGDSIPLALAMLDGPDATGEQRMAAAAFLSKLGAPDAQLAARIDAALPLNADITLRTFVDKLWSPTVIRPVVAPKLYDAEVVFTGKQLVIVRAAGKSVTLPWKDAQVAKGERVQVGLTAHGEPKLAIVTDWKGGVRVVDFDPAPTVRFR
jgi:hypothetical protein